MVSKSLVVLTIFGIILCVGCSSNGNESSGVAAALPPVQPAWHGEELHLARDCHHSGEPQLRKLLRRLAGRQRTDDGLCVSCSAPQRQRALDGGDVIGSKAWLGVRLPGA